jgi:hypothetical protein
MVVQPNYERLEGQQSASAFFEVRPTELGEHQHTRMGGTGLGRRAVIAAAADITSDGYLKLSILRRSSEQVAG